ncbi:hypothetical protein ABL78_3764 [Leptomonas seymouri]|uniref:Uncharacterized protein n=1 Tax=Leptomonas seymouri TaxID=5684 RepID=A0A0N1PDI7_LEPSE|nr:hypothetical protein ABL78_3764 [Leptomonas seymouri]|eukprot:KPI87162.1 hypothetical protein ABL78_3764 [Leptomonas seymouri]
MDRAHLEISADDKTDLSIAPSQLCPLRMPLTANDQRYDLVTPELDKASLKAHGPFPSSVEQSVSQGLQIQRSLSMSTQRQCGLSDNISSHSLSFSDEEWNPREFGPLTESYYLATTAHSGERSETVQAVLEENEDDGFYLRFVRAIGPTSAFAQRTVSAKQLLQHSSCNAEARCMGGLSSKPAGVSTDASSRSPTTTPVLGDEKQQPQRSTRYAAARELGPVNADSYIDALYLHSRERERTHFFIDPDGEIRRLYHTEGWHTLGSTNRRQNLLLHRSTSADSSGSRNALSSSKASSNAFSTGSGVGSFPFLGTGGGAHHRSQYATTTVGQPLISSQRNSVDVDAYSPSPQLKEAAFRQRSTHRGCSHVLNTISDPLHTRIPQSGGKCDYEPSGELDEGGEVSQTQSSSPRQSSLSETGRTEAQTKEDTAAEAHHTTSTASVSVGSGGAPTVPASRDVLDIRTEACFCDSASDKNEESSGSGTVLSSRVQLRISPILLHPDGDVPSSISRRGSCSSARREEDGADAYHPDMTQRRRMSTRRVSFSKETLYFKKAPFYIIPRSEKEIDYMDLTPPEQSLLAAPPSPRGPSTASTPAAPGAVKAPTQLNLPNGYLHLTLLKERITHKRGSSAPFSL